MAYTPITNLPTPPSRQEPSTFSVRADAFLGALPDFGTEVNAAGDYIDAKGIEVDADATAAAASASAASTSEINAGNSATAAANSAASAGGVLWTSGGSYGIGTVVYSPIDYKNYRAITTHSGVTTDPSLDATNWASLSGASSLSDLGVTASAAEVNYNDITTLGTSEASKVVTADANGVVTFDAGVVEDETTITSTANAITVDCHVGNVFTHVLTENTTFTFSNPPASGRAFAFTLKLVQDAGASGFTVGWPASVDWPSATAPTLTATASAIDIFVFYTHDGGTNWYGFVAGQAMATPA